MNIISCHGWIYHKNY